MKEATFTPPDVNGLTVDNQFLFVHNTSKNNSPSGENNRQERVHLYRTALTIRSK